MAELKAVTAAAGDLERRLATLNAMRFAGGSSIQNLSSLAAPKFQWDEGLRQTDNFVKNLQRGKMELTGITDLMDKWKNQSRDIAEQQTRLNNAAVRNMGNGQVQMYLPSVNDINNQARAMEVSNRQIGIQAEMLQAASTQVQNWGKNMQWAGRQLMVGFTIPFAAAAAAAGVYAYQMDQSLTRITKVYDGAQSEVKNLALETANAVTTTMGQSSKSTLEVMAQLAAVGKTGLELQQATMEVQRLSTLGDMDQETSLKSVIALQSTFKLSVEETTEAINYMNAIENATSLQMTDFAEAIPRAAAPVAQLGGEIQDLGTILVALKERGVDAAEGANAIKTLMNRLINPAEQTKKMFQDLAGQDLDEFIKSTRGELMPTMQALADTIMNGNMSLLDQQKLIGRLGGAYQLTRLTAILDGLATKSEQVQKAFDVNDQGPSKWAAAATKELEAITGSVSGRFRIAVQSFKTELQSFGEMALEMGTWIINKVAGVLGILNGIPDWIKAIAIGGAAFLAIAGPVTMLVGIFANFVGTIGRAVAWFRSLGSSYKSVTIEAKAAEIASGAVTSKFKSEADMVQVLSFQLEKLTQAYTQTGAAAQLAAQRTMLAGSAGAANKGLEVSRQAERDAAQKMSMLMDAQQTFYNKNTTTATTVGPRNADGSSKWQPGDTVFANASARRQYEEMGKEIKAQENILTQAIANRSAAVKEAMALEGKMMAVGLKELAAQEASLLTAQRGAMTTPTSLSLNGTDYRQNSAGKWINGGTGRFVSKDELAAINAGFAQVSTQAKQAGDAIEKTSMATRIFRQETMLAVSGVAMMGSMVSSAGSGWQTFFNYLTIGATAMTLLWPAIEKGVEKFKDGKLFDRMIGDANSMKAKVLNFGRDVGSGLADVLGKAGRFAISGWGIGIAAAGVAGWAAYRLLTQEGRAQIDHMQELVTTTDGWMKTLGQAKLEWGQIRDASGQAQDNMSAMVDQLRQNEKDLVEEAAKQNGGGLDTLVRGEIYRLQGQGLNRDDIIKSMETLLNAAGKKREEIERILSNIRFSFKLDGNMSDLDPFINDIKTRVKDAGIFSGAFQGEAGFGDELFRSTDRGSKGTLKTAELIKDRLTGLGETQKRIVGEQIASAINDGMNESFEILKSKYGNEIKGNLNDAVSELLVFNKNSGYSPKVGTGPDGPLPASQAQVELGLLMNQNRDTAIKLGEALNIPNFDKGSIRGFADIIKYLGTESQSAADTQKEFNELTKDMSDEEKKAMAVLFAKVRGLNEVKLASNGYADSQKKTKDAIAENNKGIEQFITNLQRLRTEHDFGAAMAGKGAMWDSQASGDEAGFGDLGGNAASQGQMINDLEKQKYQNVMGVAYDMANMQMERAYQARMDGIANYYQGIKDRLTAEGKQMDNAWDDRMRAFSDQWKDRIDATKQSYEDRQEAIENDAESQLKAVDDQIDAIKREEDAAKDLDDQRKKMFEAEERRIERLTELANANINYNRALATGNLDEAARVMNNTERLQTGWSSEDAQTAADDNAAKRDKATQARIDQLNDRKDIINEEKQTKLDALREEEDAVMRSLEKQQEAEKRNLELQRENEKERLQMRMDALQREQQAVEETERRKQEMDRKTLEIELATLRAFVPMNEEQLWAHIDKVQGAYNEHGAGLEFKGTQWGQTVGKALYENVETARVTMSNNSNWQQSGQAIGDAIAKGAFGLTLGQFFDMIITGKPPEGWKPTGASASFNHTQAYLDMKYRHTGGYIDNSPGSRAGYTGPLRPDEIPIVAQRGEFMLPKATVDRMTPSQLEDLRTGRIGVGGADLGIAGIAGAMGVAMMRAMIEATFLGSKDRQRDAMENGWSGTMASKPGEYSGVRLNADQVNNANIIARVGQGMGASQRDIVISLMTAMQESTLRNLSWGDRDSVGLFQQRPSQGWGTVQQIMNPEYAARKFFEGLLRIPNRNSMAPTLAAQAVQRSAFPYAYAQWQGMAESLVGGGLGASNRAGIPGFGMFMDMAMAAINGGGQGTGRYVRPTSGPVTSEYGMRWGKLHDGIDIGAPTGTPIYAADNGRVIQAGWNNGGFGNWTLIDHNGLVSGYAHQNSIGVRAGQNVSRGQTIGYVGNTGYSTGPHLHFQMGGGPGSFQNPRQWIPSLQVGGTINYDNVLANLHRGETVLTAPLSAALERGINDLDSGVKNEYNYSIEINGTGLSARELETVITNVIETQKMRDMKRTGKIR